MTRRCGSSARRRAILRNSAQFCAIPSPPPTTFPGIVDIFGFEVFKLNSLEQLCINFANEKLQALFTKAVFLETIEAYKADGIDADAITYTDNATLIELFDAPKVGLWATLSEECVVPKGSDEGFTEKLHQAQKGSKVMLRVKGRSRDPRSHAPHSPYPHR